VNPIRDQRFESMQLTLGFFHEALARLDLDAFLTRLNHDVEGVEPGTVHAAEFDRLRRLAVAGKAFAEAGKREGGPK